MREIAVHQVEVLKGQWDRFLAHLSMRRKAGLICKVLITPVYEVYHHNSVWLVFEHFLH